jgi:hypothetical protein
MAAKKPRANMPWEPAVWEEADMMAIRAMAAGKANDGQQKRALNFMIHKLCVTHDLSFRPGGEDGRRASDFAEGRRFPGLQLLKMLFIEVPSVSTNNNYQEKK